MSSIQSLINQLEDSGQEVFWQGKASKESIELLESLLDSRLPKSFKLFLNDYGGGGVVGEEISGIEDDDPTLEHRGTVFGDTRICREDYALPTNMVVIYLGADDVVWCLDVNNLVDNECPVVSYDVFSKVSRQISENFTGFLKEYLTLRLSS